MKEPYSELYKMSLTEIKESEADVLSELVEWLRGNVITHHDSNGYISAVACDDTPLNRAIQEDTPSEYNPVNGILVWTASHPAREDLK